MPCKIKCFIFLIILTIAFSSCDTTEPKEIVDYHNKILFTSSRSGKQQLYMMNPDGTNIRQITSGKYSHFAGRWSTDATKIVCNTEERTTTAGTQMVVMNADASQRKLLVWGTQMSWYPDGSKILFAHCPSCEIGIFEINVYLFNLNNTNLKELIRNAGAAEFSPNGDRIIFGEPDYIGNPPMPKVKIINYPGLTDTSTIGVLIHYPSWSPDGKEIAFSRRETTSSYNYDIYIMNINGSNLRRITNNKTNEPYIYPRWSPDGKKIIFLSYTVDGIKKWRIYMINVDGSNLHRIIEDNSVTSCDWSK